VVLTGSLSDGAAGLIAIRQAGGVAVVQSPADAVVPEMPKSAVDLAGADYVVAADDLAPLLVELVHRPIATGGVLHMVDPLDRMSDIVDNDMDRQVRGANRGRLSTFTCPECGGALWQVDEKGVLRFRCHVGHAYYGESLLAEMSEELEAALWTAVRTFRERAVLSRQMAERERLRGHAKAADRFEEQATLAQRHGILICEQLLNVDAKRAGKIATELSRSPESN
jgi:two-component system chemotaxis response regulator CheB